MSNYSVAGGFLSAFAIGNLLASFVNPPMASRIGRKATIVIFSAFIPVMLLVITFLPPVPVIYAAFILIGIGRGSVSIINNAVVNDNSNGRPAALNLLHMTFAAGAFAGMLPGIIHVKLKVRDLLSGIIMMTALYTVNLRIAGRANLPIYNMTTLFDNDFVRNVFKGGLAQFSNVIIILVITLVMKFLLDWYMSTKSGYLLRAVGDNETIVTSMGVDKGITKIIGLAIANGLCSLSGCIFAQQQRYFDISMGTGTMVIGLASVIIGISLLKKATFLRVTSSVVIGAIVYKACVAIAIKLGMPSSDLKLITAVLFLIILVLGMDRNKRKKVA